MKQNSIALLIGIFFLTACGGTPPVTNTPVMDKTAEVPASPTVAVPTEAVIPIPKVVLSNNLTEATGETGIPPTSINELDLSIVNVNQVEIVKSIEEVAGESVESIKSWNIAWLLANGYLNNNEGVSPANYDEAVIVAEERYEFVGNQLPSGAWSVAVKDKKTKRIGYAVNSNGIPIHSSLMPMGVDDLEDFDIVFAEMSEDGKDQFLTNNGSVFSIVEVDADRKPLTYLYTATGEQVRAVVAPEKIADYTPENAPSVFTDEWGVRWQREGEAWFARNPDGTPVVGMENWSFRFFTLYGGRVKNMPMYQQDLGQLHFVYDPIIPWRPDFSKSGKSNEEIGYRLLQGDLINQMTDKEMRALVVAGNPVYLFLGNQENVFASIDGTRGIPSTPGVFRTIEITTEDGRSLGQIITVENKANSGGVMVGPFEDEEGNVIAGRYGMPRNFEGSQALSPELLLSAVMGAAGFSEKSTYSVSSPGYDEKTIKALREYLVSVMEIKWASESE